MEGREGGSVGSLQNARPSGERPTPPFLLFLSHVLWFSLPPYISISYLIFPLHLIPPSYVSISLLDRSSLTSIYASLTYLFLIRICLSPSYVPVLPRSISPPPSHTSLPHTSTPPPLFLLLLPQNSPLTTHTIGEYCSRCLHFSHENENMENCNLLGHNAQRMRLLKYRKMIEFMFQLLI